MAKKTYDCGKCAGRCCSYTLIEFNRKEAKVMADHLGLTLKAFVHKYAKKHGKRGYQFKHKPDEVYGSICINYIPNKGCGIYSARPSVCRDYPHGNRCGYYDFLKAERDSQNDQTLIVRTTFPYFYGKTPGQTRSRAAR